MEMYKPIYKCRLCGEKFSKEEIDGEIARFASVAFMVSEQAREDICGRILCRIESHCCKDGSYGTADIIGFKKVGE